ncbi:MAG: SMP-30/gluconolactonase/LRE family protein [Balneolales bacterium]
MAVDSAEALVAFETEAVLGEGPVWDELGNKLYWVDIMSGKLFIYDPDRKTNTACNVGEHVGAFALREKGGIVMATKSGFSFLDIDTLEKTHISNPEAHLTGNRFNDGKCDPQGRFWAGTMAYDQKKEAGSLYCLQTDGNVELKVPNITISNGLTWNRQGDRFFFIDTPAQHIYAYDYEDATGHIGNPSVIREIDAGEGHPDGMTIDTDDHLWVALYGGSKVMRINPQSGETVFEVHLPVPKVTSCTFGSRDYSELYITTARENMSDEDIRQYPLSGSLFKASLPFKGLPFFRFAG